MAKKIRRSIKAAAKQRVGSRRRGKKAARREGNMSLLDRALNSAVMETGAVPFNPNFLVPPEITAVLRQGA